MNGDPVPFDPPADDWLTRGVPARRVAAWVLDLLLVGVLAVALHAAVLAVGLLTLGLGLPLLGLLPAVPFVYCWVWVALAGATPGQALVGLSVRRDRDLGAPDGLQAFLYTLGFALTLATGALWLLVVLVTTRRRALHDMVAGVTVVRRGSVDHLLRDRDGAGIGRHGARPPSGGPGRTTAWNA